MTKLTPSKARDAVKAALKQVFGRFCEPATLRVALAQDVFTGKDDPGGWSPKALVVVHCERGAWSAPVYERFWMEKWEAVDEALRAKGLPIYHEPVNGAVVAFYEG